MKPIKGFHHFYLGLALMIIAFILIWQDVNALFVWLLSVLGFIIALDDFYQHMRQRKEPEYHSPLHKLYGWFYGKISFLRKLNKIADKLFGA